MKWRKIQLGQGFRVKHGFAFKSQFFNETGEFVVLTPGNFHEEGGFRLRPGKDRFFTGGIPEGWTRKTLGEIAPLNYGKALKEDDRVPGEIPVYGSSGIVGSHEKALVKGPAIIVGRKGNVGSVFWSTVDFHPIDTDYFIVPERCSLYLFYALQSISFISTDVAVPGLNRDFAHSRKVLCPSKRILAAFENEAGAIRYQIEMLMRYNIALAKARDLLLPKLMNGEIAV